jgi:hypothetical protein
MEQIVFHGQCHFYVVRATIVRGISMHNVDRMVHHGDFHLVTAAEGILIVLGDKTGTPQTSAV